MGQYVFIIGEETQFRVKPGSQAERGQSLLVGFRDAGQGRKLPTDADMEAVDFDIGGQAGVIFLQNNFVSVTEEQHNIPLISGGDGSRKQSAKIALQGVALLCAALYRSLSQGDDSNTLLLLELFSQTDEARLDHIRLPK